MGGDESVDDGPDPEDGRLGLVDDRGVDRAGITENHKSIGTPAISGILVATMCELTRTSGAMRARALFDEHPETSAVVCGNDLIAVGVVDVCRKIGKRVPEDLELTGDDMSFSSAGPLQLSTVTVPRDLMGQRAARMLLQRIAGDEGPPRSELLPYGIQVRETNARRG